MTCETCGDKYYQWPAYVHRSRFCGATCRNVWMRKHLSQTRQGDHNPHYKTGIGKYRLHTVDTCNRCGSTKNLLAHHIDHDRANNKKENIETLCRSCHNKHHGVGKRNGWENRERKSDGKFA